MEIVLQIQRQLGSERWQQEYKLELKKGMTILEGLNEIKAHQDPTLSFTASCRSSICGACAVRVNGNAELACETLLEDLASRYQTDHLTIEPLHNFRVLRDLVVDWDEKFIKMKKISPALNPKPEFTPQTGCKQSIEEFRRYDKFASCILCGSCVSECNKNTVNPKDFLEPFIFVKADKLVEDSRSRTPEEHLQAVTAAGLWRCLSCQECTAKCPKGIDPAGAIEKLREATFRLGMDSGSGPKHAKAIYDDIYNGGYLDESKLAVQTEGLLGAALRAPMALRLYRAGKLEPFEKMPVNEKIDDVRAIIKQAEEDKK